MSAVPPKSPGDVLAGKFQIVRTLGEGGMGAVYEVEHTLTKHRRALKLLHPELIYSPSIVERFLREASAAGRIGNPHVVETFDAGQLDTGEPYIVMEFLKGKTLADTIAEDGPLELAKACQVMQQACDGIAAAHQAGIIHRDLKPENMFLAAGPDVFVKILDFGISKFDPELTGAQGITQDGAMLGTPFYMSPEQVLGAQLDEQADVYALGVVLYECLTAQKPYMADTLPHLAVMICESQYPPPSARRPELPPGWDAVVARAMARDKAARYASVLELKQAIEQQLDSGGMASSQQEPATKISAQLAPAESAAPAAPAPGRRIPAAVLGGVALVGLLGVGLALRSGSSPAPEPSASAETAAVVVAPRAPEPPPVPAPSESALPVAPSARASAAVVARPAAAAPASKPSSVSKQLGLSEDNPF